MTNKEKILVIDDEQPTLKMFTLLLSAYGYEILTLKTVRKALIYSRPNAPVWF